MSQTAAYADLTGDQARAVALLRQDDKTDEQIAGELGVTRRTLARWKLRPEFAAALAAPYIEPAPPPPPAVAAVLPAADTRQAAPSEGVTQGVTQEDAPEFCEFFHLLTRVVEKLESTLLSIAPPHRGGVEYKVRRFGDKELPELEAWLNEDAGDGYRVERIEQLFGAVVVILSRQV